ncbi:MAG: c-type cytochrome [Phycisphaerales bacterium]|nr:c-type cytochrome [Phycisphaerales bacterium]
MSAVRRAASAAALAVGAMIAAGAATDAPGRLGGPATVDVDGTNAFSLPLPGLSREDRRAFSVGNALFRDNWVVAPASAEGRDGLGPLFAASSCSACHAEDGRGLPPVGDGSASAGWIVLVSPHARDGEAHPVYGRQLQDHAVPGVRPEVRVRVDPVREHGRYADGTPFELERWKISPEEPGYGPLGEVRLSLRVGPQLVGGGLLEAVDDATILAREDPQDRDGDGISGRAHRLAVGGRVGRFGWKASQATLEDQVQAAFSEDMGITSPLFPAEVLTDSQSGSVREPSGGSPEVDAHKVSRVAHYCRTLAVPAQRAPDDPRVALGRQAFMRAGCAACHVPELRSGDTSPVAALRGAVFRPFTDLLLHDMGEGLADGRRDGDASGREWRTPPLWGIGLVPTVNGHSRYLHDGRARSLEEAVLWHGGEAQRSRDAFVAMPEEERRALLAFLASL